MLLPDKLQVNPSDCNERWGNLKFIMDDIVLPGLNSPDAPVELQIAMIPIGSLKAQLSSATKSLDKAVSRYMRMRTELVLVGSEVPPTEMDSVRLLQKVMGEVRVLYDAYDLYADQIKAVRANVMRQLDLYVHNGRLISAQLDNLLLTDRHDCLLRSYGIELSMKEYQSLEEQIDASLKSTLEIVLSALKYFMDIIDRCSDAYENLAETFEDDVTSDFED